MLALCPTDANFSVTRFISILSLNLMLTYEIPPEFRGGVHLLSVHIMYYECSSTYIHINICIHTMYYDISSIVIILLQFDQ